MQASSIAIIDAGVIPCIRIMARIMVLHMSAQFMHAGAQSSICVEHTTHACSHAAHASMQACITDMSIAGMPSIDFMSFDIASIIMESIRPSSLGRLAAVLEPIEGLACGHGRTPRAPATGAGRLGRVWSSRSRKRWVGLLGLLAGVMAVAVAAPASAHDELIGTDPADGAVVETLPGELTLTYSGVLLTGDGATEISVTDAAGTDLTTGDPVVDGVRVTQALAGSPSGAVEVAWRVVSSDGHPISGTFSFSVGDGSSATAPGEAPASDGDAGAGELLPVWIAAGVVVVILLVVVTMLLARRRPSHED